MRYTQESISNYFKFSKILLIFCLIFFSFFAFFTFPSADDFAFYEKTTQLGIWSAWKWWYFNWSGRYSSNFFLGFLNPLDLKNYRFISLALIYLNLITLYFFSNNLIKKISDNISAGFVSILICSWFILLMPSVGEGFFWHSGAFNFTTANICMLLLGNLMLGQLKNLKLLLAIILCIIIPGFNETSMALLLISLSLKLSLEFYKNGKTEKSTNILLFVSIAFSAIVIFCPGNSVRMGHEAENPAFFGLGWAIWNSFRYLMGWIFHPLALFFSFLIIFIGNKKEKPTLFPIKSHVILLLFIIFVGFFPASFIFGQSIPKRLQNTIFLFFLVSYIPLLISLKSIIPDKLITKVISFKKISWLMFFFSLFFIRNNFKHGFWDISSGNIFQFKNQIDSRIKFLSECKLQNCGVQKLTNIPKIIHFDDSCLVPRKNYSLKGLQSLQYLGMRKAFGKDIYLIQ